MKLKLNTASQDPSTSAPAATPTPSTGGGLKIKFKSSVGAAASPPTNSPAPTTIKPKLSLSSTKKRPREADDDEAPSSSSKKQATTSTIRLSQSKAPPVGKPVTLNLKASKNSTAAAAPPAISRVKIKVKGKIPPRPQGVGYDSDAEEAELDPAIEEHFILRMQPGPDCDYLRTAIAERKIGVPLRDGGANVGMRFFRSDGRRAAIRIRDTFYAAVLVDLPCIVETMKSWDKRGWWKMADICQMLLVYRKVTNEDDARHCALPGEIDDKTWQWPHGLTPPMYNVRKRRFRKRVSHRTIEAAEAEVERLLSDDRRAKDNHGVSRFEVVDLDSMREGEEVEEVEYDDEDADGEPDEEMEMGGGDEDLLASMMQQLEEDDGVNLPVSAADMGTVADVPTPTVEAEVIPVVEEATSPEMDATGITEGEDEEESEDDEDEEDEEEDDDDAKAKAQEKAAQLVDIEYLEKELKMQREAYSKQTNALLKRRMVDKLKSLEADLQIKKKAAGIVDEDA